MPSPKPRIDDRHPWDEYSDQPRIITDRAYKKRMKRKHVTEYLLTFLTSCIIFPVALFAWLFNRKTEAPSEHFFSLCVNLDKGEGQFALIEELGCDAIQVRFFLSDMDRLNEYYAFIEKIAAKQVLMVIVQDKAHIDDPQLLSQDIALVFKAFEPLVQQFQIGTTINRSKWGFFSVAEYLNFYQRVQSVRDQQFPNLQLLGPAVIDFEYPYLIRALFNGFKLRFDQIGALLYVDRRGAPENPQMKVFDTLNKITLLHSIARLSSKASSKLQLTEANWPLQKTAPWAPTSETECVSESDYANYLLRYHLQALASQRVESVHWHQLLAPGYGLVDTREGLRKREAFYVYQTMLRMLAKVEVQSYQKQGELYQLNCHKRESGQAVQVIWANGTELPLVAYAKKQDISLKGKQLLDKVENPIDIASATVSDSPIYIVG